MSDDRFSADDFRSPVLQALLDIIPGTLHIKDRALRYRVVNRYYAERWGLTVDTLVGRTATEVFGDEYDAAVEERDRHILETGSSLPFYEVRFPIEGDEPVTLWATKMPLFDASGTVTHILTFALDISPLKAMEQALDETERLRAATVQRALDAVVAVDDAGRIIEFNLAAEDMFGHRREDVMGRLVDDVIIPAELRHGHRTAMNRLTPGNLANRRGRRLDTRALRADGSTFPVEIGVAEITLDDRSVFTAHIKDLTAEREMAEALERQREALNHGARLSAIGTLVASLSHELRNPLSVITGQTVLLEETATDASSRDRARRISAAAERCSAIVERFLDTARKRPERLETLALGAVVDGTADLLETLLRGAGVQLHRHGNDAGLRVRGDRQQLGQVVMNLVMNAEQAMRGQPRSREIHVHLRPDAVGGRLELRVEDTGPGIEADVLPRLFTPFVTSRAEGTGLGLAVSKDIVEAHGGEIHAEPAPGGGACFVIRLPTATTEVTPLPAVAVPRIVEAPLVLAVDDEPDVLETLVDILASRGCRVLAADSVAGALDALAEEPVQAVVSDYRLGDGTGAELWHTVRDRWPALAERFALVTGEQLPGSVADELTGAGVVLVRKPFTPMTMTELLHELLDTGELP